MTTAPDRLAHTPYDGSSTPFTIGLRPLDPAEWIEVDERLVEQLALKEQLLATRYSDVVVAEPGTEAAQSEVLDLLVEHLPRRFPSIYRREGGSIAILPAGRSVDLAGAGPPLVAAARLVQEDLVLMRRSEAGWRLAAAVLCFPSSWTLTEKFGRPLDDIHAPVPGFGAGTRVAGLIARIFDNLAVERPVERTNWSLQEDAELHRPRSEKVRIPGAAQERDRFLRTDPAAAFMRVERQTLRRLPVSGDILFTIRIHMDPLAKLAAHPERAKIAASFADQLAALSADQLAYKGLAGPRDAIVEALRRIAAA